MTTHGYGDGDGGLRAAQDVLVRARAAAYQAMLARDAAVRQAVATGMTHQQVATTTGVSVALVRAITRSSHTTTSDSSSGGDRWSSDE
jgi:hypothetical protein